MENLLLKRGSCNWKFICNFFSRLPITHVHAVHGQENIENNILFLTYTLCHTEMKFIILLLAWWKLYRNTGSWWNPQDSSLHMILSETYLLHQKAIFVVTAIKYFKYSLVTVIFDLWANIKVYALNDNRLSVDAPYSPWAFHTTRCKLWMLRWFNRYCFIQVYVTTTIWKFKKTKWKNVMWLANELLKEKSFGFKTLCPELTDVMSHCLNYCMSKNLQVPHLPMDRPHFLREIWDQNQGCGL